MIRIYADRGGDLEPSDYEIVAQYDPDEEVWIEDAPDLEQFYPPGTAPGVLLEQLDGPTYIAVDETREGEGEQLTFGGDR